MRLDQLWLCMGLDVFGGGCVDLFVCLRLIVGFLVVRFLQAKEDRVRR